MITISDFRADYFFLSNFCPARIGWDGEVWPTVEHAYQAAKTMSPKLRELVRVQATAHYAKQVGRLLPIRQDWEMVKLDVMLDLLRRKFSHPEFARWLLDTGDAELIEGNTWNDTYWGVCRGVGENHLGRLLMTVRAELPVTAIDPAQERE